MAQGYCTIAASPQPFAVWQTCQAGGFLTVAAPVAIVWSDGTVDSWPAGVVAVSAYGGNTFDTAALVWLVLALKGVLAPYVVKEMDYARIDTVLTTAGQAGATWAVLARVEQNEVWRIPQV